MELRHLRYYLALADELDLAKAAKHCRLTPSVMSRHISDLEESLGCSLFRRHGAHISMTAAGQVFYQRAKGLLDSAAAAAGEARATAEAVANQVKIGHFGTWWLKRYEIQLKSFAASHPRVKLHPLEYSPADISLALRRGEVDMALLEAVDVAMRIEFKVKRIEAIAGAIVVSKDHLHAKKKQAKLKDFADAVWVVWDERVYPGRRHLLLDAAKEARFVPCVSWEAESEAAMFEQVLAGNSVGYHAPHLIDHLPEGLVLLPVKPTLLEFPVFLAWRRDADHVDRLDQLAEAMLAPTTLSGKRS